MIDNEELDIEAASAREPVIGGEEAATSDATKTVVPTQQPLCTRRRLGELSQLVNELIDRATKGCANPDELRYVAAVFKGIIDVWHRGGK